MNRKIFFMFFVLGTFLISGSYALANDEFVVDLSVLGDVSSNNKPYESVVPVVADNNHPLLIGNNQNKGGSVSSILNLPPLEPKFPVVTAKPVTKVVKAKKIKPVAKPIVEEKIIIEEPVVAPEVVEIEMVEAEVVAPEVVEIEMVEAEVVAPEVVEVETEVVAPEVVAPEVVAPEVVEVETEVFEAEVVAPEVVEVETEVVEAEVVAPEVVEVETEVVEAEVVAPEVVEIEMVEAEVVAPEVEIVEPVNGIISFQKEIAEITEADKNKIDLILQNFQDAHTNKISIISYNVESAGISFKNKRQSLARATNIRSYLISKGYKNFDIKVADIAEDSKMVDCVLISEIIV